MFLGKIIKGCTLSALILGCAFSASALEAHHKELGHSHKGYFKPGAAVALTYDYDGQTELGALENITLTLEHYYDEGYISARILETNDLHIMSHQVLKNERLRNGINLQLPIQISGTQSGEYYISLEVIYESLSGNQSLRVLSLPVQIGKVDTSKASKTDLHASRPIAEKGFVILDAQEVIK